MQVNINRHLIIALEVHESAILFLHVSALILFTVYYIHERQNEEEISKKS